MVSMTLSITSLSAAIIGDWSHSAFERSPRCVIGWWALPVTAAVYALIWGDGLYKAIRYRLALAAGGEWVSTLTAGCIAWQVFAAIVLIVVYQRLRRPPAPLAARASFWAAVRLTSQYMLIITVGFVVGTDLVVAGLLTRVPVFGADSPHPGSGQPVLSAVQSVLAGPLEELALVAVPLLLFGCRRSLPWFCAILVVVRVSFHIYYGLSIAVGIAVWAGLALLMYLRTGRILPLIAGHSLCNLLNVVQNMMNPESGLRKLALFLLMVPVLVGVILVVILIITLAWGLITRRISGGA